MKKNICLLVLSLILLFSFNLNALTLKSVNNQNYLPELLRLIDSSKKNIKITALSFFTDNEIGEKILEHLIEAKKRNVRIYVFMEGDKENISERNMYTYHKLKENGISVKLDSEKIVTHAKYILIDNKYCLIGSTNLSKNSILNNNETNLLITSKDASKFLSKYFRDMWINPEKNFSRKSELIDSQLIIFTDQEYYSNIAGLIDSAETSLHMIMYYFGYNSKYPESKVSLLFDKLIEAHKRGVKIKLYLEKSSFHEYLNSQSKISSNYLRKNGIKDIVYDSSEKITHSKIIIVDEKTLKIGSTNWYWKGIDKHHQINAIIYNKNIAEDYLNYFNGLFNGK